MSHTSCSQALGEVRDSDSAGTPVMALLPGFGRGKRRHLPGKQASIAAFGQEEHVADFSRAKPRTMLKGVPDLWVCTVRNLSPRFKHLKAKSPKRGCWRPYRKSRAVVCGMRPRQRRRFRRRLVCLRRICLVDRLADFHALGRPIHRLTGLRLRRRRRSW